MQNEQAGEIAFTIHSRIEDNELSRRRLLLENAELIHKMHSEQYYKAILGDENAPWSAYLSQHGIYYSASKVYALDKVYSKFVKELRIPLENIVDIPITKLGSLIPIVNKENVEAWITKARELTSQDFQDELRIASGKESYLTCPHSKEKIYAICQSCGFRHQPNEETKVSQ